MKKKQTVGWVYMIYEEEPFYCQIERGGPVLLTILERMSHLVNRVSWEDCVRVFCIDVLNYASCWLEIHFMVQA